MKKIKMCRCLKKLSLFQQLIVLLAGIACVLIFVMMPIIDYNLKTIIDNQMYETLSTEQNIIMNNTSIIPPIGKRNTVHIVYDGISHSVIASNLMHQQELNKLYRNVFSQPLEHLMNQSTKSVVEGKSEDLRETYYYMITRLSSSRYLVSIIDSAYSNEMIMIIRNQIIYIQYAFFFVIAAILIFWVVSLISPLRKVKDYIDAIKNRKDSALHIDRGDEIGVVFKALNEMKDELKRQEKIKEEMIHNMSHDLKTPIALIKTYGQSIKDDIYPYGDKDSSMDVIIENAERLEHKVKSFLYLNRLDYLNSENKNIEMLSMKPLIEKIVEQMETLNIDIHFHLELDDVCFLGEEEHWRVAIENLIDNASRYATSLIAVTLQDGYLEIYNDGEVIDEEMISYLFMPYVKSNKGQFGLGLSIVNKIVKMYDFDVFAYNKDEGVSFIIKKASELR